MMKFALPVALALITSACARDIVSTVPFNSDEVSFIRKSGSAEISGQAFLRQNGGGVVTCAGQVVQLIPAGKFARERFAGIYGNEMGGKISVLQSASQEGLDPQYLTLTKNESCDAEGDFVFSNVAAGSYYVVTTVTWTVGNQIIPEGGALAKLVDVREGQKVRALLN
jgi:hypothetical protein